MQNPGLGNVIKYHLFFQIALITCNINTELEIKNSNARYSLTLDFSFYNVFLRLEFIINKSFFVTLYKIRCSLIPGVHTPEALETKNAYYVSYHQNGPNVADCGN